MNSYLECSVAVTGLSATDNPAPGIGVVRSLRASETWQGRIIGLAYDSLDTGIYDRELVDEVYLIPYPNQGEGNLLERLRQILSSSLLQVIVPTLDSELLGFVRLESELVRLGVHLLIPSESQVRMRSKAVLQEFGVERGFPMPQGAVVVDAAQIEPLGKQFGYPLVVKGHFYEAEVSRSLDEAVVYFNRIKSRWGLPLIVQQYLSGEEYDVAALCNRDGEVVGSVAMRKLRITEKGKAWAGITVRDEALLSLSQRILAELKWVGPVELEFIRDMVSKQYFLIEVNPRFPSWIYLASMAGQNLPLASVQLALGEKVSPLPPYQVGVLFVRHAADLVFPLKYLEQLTTRGKLIFRDLNGCR